jgi:hypothetical protein
MGCGQPINVRRLDVRAAVEPHVFPAKIVGHDVDDVGFCLGGQDCQRQTAREQRRENAFTE